MVLNLLRVEEVNPEYMLERSFYQFQNNSSIPSKQQSKQFVASQAFYNLFVLVEFVAGQVFYNLFVMVEFAHDLVIMQGTK